MRNMFFAPELSVQLMTAPARRQRVMRNLAYCAPPICVDRSGHVCRCDEATASKDVRTGSREEGYRNAPGIQQSIYRPRRVQVVERHEARNEQSAAHSTCTDLIHTAASGATSLMSIHALRLCARSKCAVRQTDDDVADMHYELHCVWVCAGPRTRAMYEVTNR